jgi:predicted amidohydrolase YtcJ
VLARPEVPYLPHSVGETFGWWPPNNTYVNRFDKQTIPWFQTQYHLLEQTAKAFQDSGVPLLAGTDTPTSAVVPGFSLHDVLKALVAAGLTPYQALQTATVHAATFLGCSRTAGTIDVGKRADFVLLEQNPLNDISHLSAIGAVMVNGRWISKSSLRWLLQNARKQQDKE